MNENDQKKVLILDASYVTARTRILSVLFPDIKKEIVQHDLQVIAGSEAEQFELLQSTFDSPEEFEYYWMLVK